MKLLLVCMEFNYGDPSRGRSYEYYNFFESLKALGVDVELFDFFSEEQKLGREAMNQKLVDRVTSWKPDLTMFSLYTDQILEETVSKLKPHTTSLCFFHDDTWRTDFSLFWAGKFDYFTTPDPFGAEKYRKLGLDNVIEFAFGCNDSAYKKLDVRNFEFDVSFVGAWHPYREWLIKRLRKKGFEVSAFGFGWPSGVVDQNRMVEIFNNSKINLNLSNSASWDARYLISSPRGLVNRLRSPKTIEQMKARIFELPCCGGFELTYYVEGIEKYFEVGKEIAIYTDPDDLDRKVAKYLNDNNLRDDMSAAGYARAQKDHTFKKRFNSAFSKMNLPQV